MNNNPLITFSTTPDGEWSYRITPEGNRSHLLQFLVRSCPEQLPPARQLLSKLCAIGYLLKPEKDRDFSPAVVGVSPNPEAGQSLFGDIIAALLPTARFSGEETRNIHLPSAWIRISDNSRVVFLDRLPRDFYFDCLFSYITGVWSFEIPRDARLVMPDFELPLNHLSGALVQAFDFKRGPKIYIAASAPIIGVSPSFEDRQWTLPFPDSAPSVPDGHPLPGFAPGQEALTSALVRQCGELYRLFGYVPVPPHPRTHDIRICLREQKGGRP